MTARLCVRNQRATGESIRWPRDRDSTVRVVSDQIADEFLTFFWNVNDLKTVDFIFDKQSTQYG